MSRKATFVIALVLGVVLGADLGTAFAVVFSNFLLACVYFAALLFVVGLGAVLARSFVRGKEISDDQRIWTELGASCAGLTLCLLAAPIVLKMAQAEELREIVGNGALVGLVVACGYIANELALDYQEYRLVRSSEAALRESQRLLALEQFQDSQERLKEAILGLEMQYGSNHIRPADLVFALAELFLACNEPLKASAMYRRALSVYERVLGPRDAKVAACIISMTKTDPEADPDDMLLLLRRALSIREQQLGPQSPEVGDVFAMVATAHAAKERWPDAEEALRKSIQISEKNFPESDPERLRRSGRLAGILLKVNKNSEAERILKSVAAVRKNSKMSPDQESIQLAVDLGHLLVQQNQGDQASDVWMEALVALRDEVGPQHPSTKSLVELCLPRLCRDWPPGSQDFMKTVMAGDTYMLKKQVELFPDLPKSTDSSGWTPVQWVVFLNQEKAMESLLQSGGTADLENVDWPPIHIAARWGYRRLLQILFTKAAPVNRLNSRNWTALHRAAQAGDDIAVQSLLNKEADPNLVNDEGETPLHIAARLGYPRVVVELVAQKAIITQVVEKTGKTALHLAAEGGHRSIAECLLLNNNDVAQIADRDGQRASALARAHNHKSLADYIAKQEQAVQA